MLSLSSFSLSCLLLLNVCFIGDSLSTIRGGGGGGPSEITTQTSVATATTAIFTCPESNNVFLYNTTFTVSNTATCNKIDPLCNYKTTNCMGVVACSGVTTGTAKCCLANQGIKDEGCDGDSYGQEEYFFLNGSPCYYKKGQKSIKYFNVCKSDFCYTALAPTGVPVATPSFRPIVAPTGVPVVAPTGVPVVAPTLKPAKPSYIGCYDRMYTYNKSVSVFNTATCFIANSCDYKKSLCVGYVVCEGECCLVNRGAIDEPGCEGTPYGWKEYSIENGSPCYYKKGQKNRNYFNVCKSSCVAVVV